MLYYLSPCAHTNARWLGDNGTLVPELATVISTACQMLACERDARLDNAKEYFLPSWWQWGIKSQSNLEYLISLYEALVIQQNLLHFRTLQSYKIVNPAREYQLGLPSGDWCMLADPERERAKFMANVVGTKVYIRQRPPYWLVNRQRVIGEKPSDSEDSPLDSVE